MRASTRRALYVNPARAQVTHERLAEYDANIGAHSVRLRMTEGHGRTWKPHQYLALLFTEHYLRRYFDESEALRADLNLARRQEREMLVMPEYTPDDLRVLAFQSATGSGKTLLMHAHILQYRHYLSRAGGRLNNVVLLTPNEQMSAQHERELHASGLHARLFSSEAGADLFQPVEILDLNKLAEKKGVKRVAVRDFGDDNLVLVDEGHLGASGKVWRERRRELSSGGFTFEYSATFNQVVRAKDPELLHAYGKCLLFDYAYRRFHADGYGKDYAISNLPPGAEDENSEMYLLGCLLTFYQQCRVWRDKAAGWKAFNPAKPLWVFLARRCRVQQGGSGDPLRRRPHPVVPRLGARPRQRGASDAGATAGRPLGAAGRCGRGLLRRPLRPPAADRSRRLRRSVRSPVPRAGTAARRLSHGGRGRVAPAPRRQPALRRGQRGRLGGALQAADRGRESRLRRRPGAGLRRTPFCRRGPAGLDGERRHRGAPLHRRLELVARRHDGPDARRVGEGPEIIQMFGRGVRLKGWNMSLKRHRESGADLPPDSAALQELETLYIFGLRANYMQTFRDLLQAEGMRVDRETITLPVTWNFGRQKKLKLIRLKDDLKYEHSDRRPVLPNPGDADTPPAVEMDLHSRLQAVASGDVAGERDVERPAVKLHPRHVALFDRTRIRDALTAHKQRKGWHNLVIRPETVERLLESDAWYVLHAPPERMQVRRFEDVRALEGIAVELITEYAAAFWKRERRQWERDRIEVVRLDEKGPNNIGEYRLSIDTAETRLIEDVRELTETLQAGHRYDLKLGVLKIDAHAYYPLLHADKGLQGHRPARRPGPEREDGGRDFGRPRRAR